MNEGRKEGGEYDGGTALMRGFFLAQSLLHHCFDGLSVLQLIDADILESETAKFFPNLYKHSDCEQGHRTSKSVDILCRTLVTCDGTVMNKVLALEENK